MQGLLLCYAGDSWSAHVPCTGRKRPQLKLWLACLSQTHGCPSRTQRARAPAPRSSVCASASMADRASMGPAQQHRAAACEGVSLAAGRALPFSCQDSLRCTTAHKSEERIVSNRIRSCQVLARRPLLCCALRAWQAVHEEDKERIQRPYRRRNGRCARQEARPQRDDAGCRRRLRTLEGRCAQSGMPGEHGACRQPLSGSRWPKPGPSRSWSAAMASSDSSCLGFMELDRPCIPAAQGSPGKPRLFPCSLPHARRCLPRSRRASAAWRFTEQARAERMQEQSVQEGPGAGHAVLSRHRACPSGIGCALPAAGYTKKERDPDGSRSLRMALRQRLFGPLSYAVAFLVLGWTFPASASSLRPSSLHSGSSSGMEPAFLVKNSLRQL